jgi:hypothetical protein
VFWRRVLHTCHHRTQVQTWLRLAGHEPVPAIYGPSGDVTWDGADPTYSADAARRGTAERVPGPLRQDSPMASGEAVAGRVEDDGQLSASDRRPVEYAGALPAK